MAFNFFLPSTVFPGSLPSAVNLPPVVMPAVLDKTHDANRRLRMTSGNPCKASFNFHLPSRVLRDRKQISLATTWRVTISCPGDNRMLPRVKIARRGGKASSSKLCFTTPSAAQVIGNKRFELAQARTSPASCSSSKGLPLAVFTSRTSPHNPSSESRRTSTSSVRTPVSSKGAGPVSLPPLEEKLAFLQAWEGD